MLEIFNPNKYDELVSWNELDIGDFYIHIHSKKFSVKTGRWSYFTIDDRSYHHRPTLLQEHDYKNFVRCSFRITCHADLDEMMKEWRKQF